MPHARIVTNLQAGQEGYCDARKRQMVAPQGGEEKEGIDKALWPELCLWQHVSDEWAVPYLP
jgi:hypothetical protein